MKKLISAIGVLTISFSVLSAQPQKESRPAPPKQQAPEEIARHQADMMKAEIGINDKQYKKVYNLIKKDFEYRQNQSRPNFGNGFPPQGGPGGGMGGPGMGGPGGGMGGPGMGGPGGGMGGPGMGGSGMGRPEGGPEGFGGPGKGMGPRPEGSPVSDEYLEKQEQKLKKILTPEQYDRWRGKHPAEHHALPPLEFK